MRLRLGDFAGAWQLARVIDDRLAGRRGSLQGEARFVPDGRGLVYTEEGTLVFPGQTPVTASQSYLWRKAADAIEVRFSDGRAFHVIGLTVPVSEARHDCAPDVYRVAYDFSAWPDWSATWAVAGPRKDYTMVSHYFRA